MRVLWVVNLPFSEVVEKITNKKTAYSTQSWLQALISELAIQDNIEIMIVAPMITKSKYEMQNGNILYVVIPVKDGEMYNYPININTKNELENIINYFKPDLIHIHGTEFTHSLSVVESANGIPVVVSIQGILEICERRYFADISPIKFLLHRKIADFKYGGAPESKKQFKRRAEYERMLLKSVRFVIGRTDWDHAFIQSVNPEAKYFHCEEAMRKPFFENTWNISKIERHTILAPAAYYPIKGFHMLLHATNILKKRFPDIKIRVLGPNILENRTFKQKLLQSDYSSYLRSLIKEYNLEKNIDFLGTLSGESVAKVMKESHTMVVPSAVENGSNTLAEAMLIGLPCVASTSGGMMTTITNNETGFNYSFGDYELLAYYISNLWEDDKLTLKISNQARLVSHEKYKPDIVCKKTLNIYKKILSLN